MFVNKVIVGSGSKGTPKYTGQGVTYWVFLGYYSQFFHMYMPTDVLYQDVHTLGYVIMMLHHEMISYGTLMTSSHDVVIMSEA